MRRDGDDAYLVVAADKGTATFSDIANEVAQSYGFWLGDAFASGGSVGYDHKAMGITAKGAWEAVRRQFREMGVDTQSEDFTVVGIGDMSGDVFGNGMLLSKHIRLLAAFDHRHIFIDPDPDAARSWDERQRLFDLPRSSWEDYDTSLISEGGGVYSRQQKAIPISPQARAALGIEDGVEEMTPPALMKAILKAPADLLFNGGIGTYIKAETESDADVGDRANDPVRVNGNQVRAKVIGEGGNLGVTSLGRVEFDLAGGRINTDALDNSAGVDCSDHEVNIKILIDSLVTGGKVRTEDRTDLLLSMTDEVGRLVLKDNEDQNDLMGTSRANAASLLPVHARMIKDLAQDHGLNRELEALPSEKEIRRRTEAGIGLTSPELATLMAHVKLALKNDVLASDLPDQEAFASRLPWYFPANLREEFSPEIRTHQLRREIVTTMVVNDLVDTSGISYAYRISEDVGVGPVDAVRSYAATDAIFRINEILRQIRAAGRIGGGVGPDDVGFATAGRPCRALAAELPAATVGSGRRNQPVRSESRLADAPNVGVAARRRQSHRRQGGRRVRGARRLRGPGLHGRDRAVPVQPARRHRHRRHRRPRARRSRRHVLRADGSSQHRRAAHRGVAAGARRSMAFLGAAGNSRRYLRVRARAVLRCTGGRGAR